MLMHESLQSILTRANARAVMQTTVRRGGVFDNAALRGAGESAVLTMYAAGGKLVMYVEYDGAGWDVFVPAHDGNGVADTLARLARYLGVANGCTCPGCMPRPETQEPKRTREWSQRVELGDEYERNNGV